jgi:hypothetical protein
LHKEKNLSLHQPMRKKNDTRIYINDINSRQATT